MVKVDTSLETCVSSFVAGETLFTLLVAALLDTVDKRMHGVFIDLGYVNNCIVWSSGVWFL